MKGISIPTKAKPGQKTMMTAAEEKLLANYAVHMSKIGYPLTTNDMLAEVHQLKIAAGRGDPEKAPTPRWFQVTYGSIFAY